MLSRGLLPEQTGSNSRNTTTSTTKTLLYTISFVFLFLFLEYSLNYISSSTSSFGNNINDKLNNNNIDKSSQWQYDTDTEKDYKPNPNDALYKNPLSSDVSYKSLSSSLIEKEKLLIEKEEKYVVALKKLNERDLKLNYVDEQLYKLQSLLNKYKSHTKNLQTKLIDLQSKLNQSKSTEIQERQKMDNMNKQNNNNINGNGINNVQGYQSYGIIMKQFKQMDDEEIEALLNQTRKQIQKDSEINHNGQYINIDVEKVIKIEEKDKIIDKHEDEYILASKKSSLNSNTQIVDFRLIWDLGVVLIAATFGGIIASLFNQPLILGYLLGGSFVGPGGLKLIQQYVQVETLAHIGSIFLLFNVGIEFKYNKIQKYLKDSILSLILCCIALYFTCYAWFAWINNENQFNLINITIFVFASLNTSTTVVLKTLDDLILTPDSSSSSDNKNNKNNHYIHHYDDQSRNIITAILLFQDLYFIFFMAVFSSVTQQQENRNFIYKLMMVIIVIIIVFKALPNLLTYLRKLISIDIYILFTISLCIIFTLITQNIFESSGLGAFTAGLLISKSNVTNENDNKLLKTNWEPIRNMFGVLFFASIGMLINPAFLWINCYLILSLVLFISFGKWTMIYLSEYILQKQNNNLALNVSTSLCLQGEFAFVLSAHAHLDKLITMQQHTALIGATAVSILITPFVIRHVITYFVQFMINGKALILNPNKKSFKS